MRPADGIVVLGMHRSGTSVVARLLGALGCWLGERPDLGPASPHDPEGYHEYRPVRELNTALLEELGGSWYRVTSLGEELTPVSQRRLGGRCRQALSGLRKRTPWAVKDPRFSLVLPFWADAIEGVVCVLVHRDPIEVALSLRHRDGFPLSFGLALWEHYTLEALRATRGLPRVEVSYARLVRDPRGELRRLHENLTDLGLNGLELPDDAVGDRLVTPHLYRQRRADQPELNSLPDPRQRGLAERLEQGRLSASEPLPRIPDETWKILELGGEMAESIEGLARSEERLEEWVGGLSRLLAAILGSRRWRLAAAARRAIRGEGDEEATAAWFTAQLETWRPARPGVLPVKNSDDH